jgi:hypothetical protein
MTAERSTSVYSRSGGFSRLSFAAVCGLVAALVFCVAPPVVQAATLGAPARVALVVPLSVQSGVTGFLSPEELAAMTAPSGYLTRLLQAVINQPVTLGIDPMIVVSIRILGSDAPPSAVAWLDRLAAASNESFSLGYADSDLTLPLQAGSSSVLAPAGLEFAIEPERFTGVPSEGTETGAPSNVVTIPTTETLLEWDHSLTDIAWPYAATVSGADLDVFAASASASTILSSANVRRDNRALAAGNIGGHAVVVTDDALSAQLAAALESRDLASWQRLASLLVSDIKSVAVGAPQGARLAIAVPRGELSDPSRLRSTITALAGDDSIRLVGLSGVQSLEKTSIALIDSLHPDADISRVEPLLISEAADGKFAQVARDPARIIGERRIDLLASLAPAWNRYAGGWGVATERFTADSIALRSSVRIVESSEITFAADRGLLPVTVENGLTQAVTVFITVRPTTPLLSFESDSFEIEIEPLSQRKALLPAEALSNGTVELIVSLRSAGGDRIGEPTSVTTRVQAGWETPVTLGLGVVVAIIFIAGVYRTVTRRRREAAESSPDFASDALSATTEPTERSE